MMGKGQEQLQKHGLATVYPEVFDGAAVGVKCYATEQAVWCSAGQRRVPHPFREYGKDVMCLTFKASAVRVCTRLNLRLLLL